MRGVDEHQPDLLVERQLLHARDARGSAGAEEEREQEDGPSTHGAELKRKNAASTVVSREEVAIVWIFILGGMLVTFVPMMADRSRHRPGNVAPIQLISTIGAWALLLLDASIGDRSLSVSCASFATLLTILVLFLRGDGARVVSSQPPETIDAMVHEIEQILGSAPRTGIESVKAVIVAGSVPLISVSVPRRGHIVVRVRQDLLPWLERHRSPGGAGDAAAGSLLRFTFLHELGHVLNGDHLTYRFVRSVLVAHLWWLAAAAIGC